MSRGNLQFVRKLVEDAIAEGFTLVCTYAGEVDYRGRDANKALEALTACDEMTLRIRDANGKQVGVAFIVNDQSFCPEEVIADTGGTWMDQWWERRIG